MTRSKDSYEDTHFYIDNVPPSEVSYVLRVLFVDSGLTSNEIAQAITGEYGFEMQRDHSYSPRRLYDLGVACQDRQGQKINYRLTEQGAKLQKIQAMNSALAIDLLHYLHYTTYSGNPRGRKYLWSYRKCCEIIWSTQRVVPNKDLASQILSKMSEEFSFLDWTARVGARFNSTAAGCVYTWLRALEPSPFMKSDRNLHPRFVQRFELALLALDDTYRSRQYRYGDAVLMDESLVNQIAGVFFLDPRCCTNLLRLSANIVPSVKMSDTLGGASINLLHPFSIDDL
jgi:DNA-binding transcriptional ArsR family regulator